MRIENEKIHLLKNHRMWNKSFKVINNNKM